MEIEQKYLLKYLPENLKSFECHEIEQGYLNKSIVVRIRRWDDRYILTYKKRKETKNLVNVNEEIEMPLDKTSYEHLKTKVDGYIIKKKRYIIPLENGLKAELDIFEGNLDGFSLVEVEFPSEKNIFSFKPPEWFGENVSNQMNFTNSYLSMLKKKQK